METTIDQKVSPNVQEEAVYDNLLGHSRVCQVNNSLE